MKICSYFHYSTTVEDALQALGRSQGAAKLLAGGTDLLLDLQQGRHAPVETLVDITNIPELNLLEKRQKDIFIGAAVPLNSISTAASVNLQAQALAEASALIGGSQVRNVATLGGNIAHALPAADGTIALMALNTRVEIATQSNRRIVPLADLFKGPGQSNLNPKKELLVAFYIPQNEGSQASAFKRIMRPQGVAIAILNCAVWLHREGETLKDIRISIGPSGPIPKRLHRVENELRGKKPGPAEIEAANKIVLKEATFRSSKHRASQEYRKELAGVLLRETLQLAWERTGA